MKGTDLLNASAKVAINAFIKPLPIKKPVEAIKTFSKKALVIYAVHGI